MSAKDAQRLSVSPTAAPRLDGVDLLRGLCILAVVLLHIHLRMYFSGLSIQPMLPPWLFRLLFTNGNNGVTVFFAISGFLITLTSLRRFGSLAKLRPTAFYRIRFARIAPLLLLLLAVLSVLHLGHAPGFQINPAVETLPRAVLAALTFYLNWLEAARGFLPANWDILWSLSIEEMFYLFFPMVCLGLLRLRRGMPLFLALLLLFVTTGPFARTIWTTNEIWREKSYLGGMDAIALGCLFALLTDRLFRRGDSWRIRKSWLWIAIELVGAALMLLIAVWPRWHWMRYVGRSGVDGTLLALGACLVSMATALRGSTGRRWTTPIRWFGRHSYEVYLTHEFIVVWGTALYLRLHLGPLALWWVAMLLLTAPLGAMVAHFFSEPLNRRLRGALPLRPNSRVVVAAD